MFKPKPLSKAEQVYLHQLKKRPSDALINEVHSKIQEASQQAKVKKDGINNTL